MSSAVTTVNVLWTRNPALEAVRCERARLLRSVAAKICLLATAVLCSLAFCMLWGILPVASPLIAYAALGGGLLARAGSQLLSASMEWYEQLAEQERAVAAKVQGDQYLGARIEYYDEQLAQLEQEIQHEFEKPRLPDNDQQARRIFSNWARYEQVFLQMRLQRVLCRKITEDRTIPFTHIKEVGQFNFKSYGLRQNDQRYHPGEDIYFSAEGSLPLSLRDVERDNVEELLAPSIVEAKKRWLLAHPQ